MIHRPHRQAYQFSQPIQCRRNSGLLILGIARLHRPVVRPGREAAGNYEKLWFIMTGEMCPWGKGVCSGQREPG